MKSGFIGFVGAYLLIAAALTIAATSIHVASPQDHRTVAAGVKAPAALPAAVTPASASLPGKAVARFDQGNPDGKKNGQRLLHFDP